MSVFIGLASTCEEANEPDRNLDAMIHWQVKGGVGVGMTQDAPAYTASIDAAATLVPTELFKELRPGTWWWMVDNLGCEAHVAYENHDSGIPEYGATASSPALALCAAALKARDAVARYAPNV